jgi:hypothetical protein
MWIALFNNIPEIALGLCWSYTMLWAGMRFERWRTSNHVWNRHNHGEPL